MDTASLIRLLNIAALVTIMLSIGLAARFEEVAKSVKHVRPVVFGFIASFVLVPLVTVTLLVAVRPDPLVSAGFLILAVCPGAPLGPAFTRVAKADVSLATGMMVLLAGLSVVLSPFLLGVMLGRITPESNTSIDYLAILMTLSLTQLLPLAIGLAVHSLAPAFAQKLAKPMRVVGNVLLLGLIGSILFAQHGTLAAIRMRAWLGMSALLAASLGIGWFCGGRDVAKQKSMSLTTGTRNVAVGLVIAGGSFAGTPAVTAVVAYGLFSTLGALACAFLFAKGSKTRLSSAMF
jgi:BASS family bile acid:Na+ symporter